METGVIRHNESPVEYHWQLNDTYIDDIRSPCFSWKEDEWFFRLHLDYFGENKYHLKICKETNKDTEIYQTKIRFENTEGKSILSGEGKYLESTVYDWIISSKGLARIGDTLFYEESLVIVCQFYNERNYRKEVSKVLQNASSHTGSMESKRDILTLEKGVIMYNESPVEYSWRLDDTYIEGIRSPYFSWKNDKWFFLLHLDFFRENIRHFKICKETNKDTEIYRTKIRFENQKGKCILSGEGKYLESTEYDLIILPKGLERIRESLFHNECLVIVCQFYSEENSRKNLQDASSLTVSMESPQTLSDDLKNLFTSGAHADVKLKIGKKEFHAHKSVLAARSPVLNSIFSNHMFDESSGIINVSGCDEDAFEIFLTYLYSGKLENIECNKIEQLYEIANQYNVGTLKQECLKHLKS